MATKAYYANIPERPTEVLELRPFNDGSNRGCKIIDMHEDVAQEGWAEIIQCPARIVSIAGERITGYTFKNIHKKLARCALPIRLRLESILSSHGSHSPQPHIQSSDSESDTDNSHRKRRNQFSSTYNKQRITNYTPQKYKHGSHSHSSHSAHYSNGHKKTPKMPKLKKTDSNESSYSTVSINLQSSTAKECSVPSCTKKLKERKQHRCRRCASVVCSKCSKNKRKEVGYDKLVRVCDPCIKRDEFSCLVQRKPLGIQIGPLYGKTNDIGGILIICVKEQGGIKDIEKRHLQREEEDGYSLNFEKTVIISIGESEDNMRNIELLPYNDGIEQLRVQDTPFYLSCKKWNRNTKKSAKNQLEREHQELIAQQLAELQRDEEETKKMEANKDKKKKKKKQKCDDEKSDRPSTQYQHRRNGTDSSLASCKSENDSPYVPTDQSPVLSTHHSFTSANVDRYAGSHAIEDHAAMKLILLAEEAEKNNDIELAALHYENAIKQFNNTIHEILNNKIKRKWREKVNDYEIQKLRINRKLRLRKKIAKETRLKPGTRMSRRANTMQPMKRKQRKTSGDYTADMKSESDKAKGNSGDNGDGDESNSSKKNKKAKDQDSAFRSRLEADIISEKPNVSFKDVMGLANVKLAIYETVVLPQKRPELFTGLRAPAMGLLLFGPPGNGKTMIAKCVATEIDSTFFSISASSITSKYVGDAERIMRTLFGLAREKAPSIIFIDEIDSLLTARGGKNEAESSRRIKTEFLVQFDGVHSAKDLKASILVVGATNLPDQLDEAVLRRFSKRILVPQPEYETRYGLIRSLMRDEPHTLVEQDFMRVAKATERYSCSDLAHLCKDAALGPLREMGAVLIDEDFDESNLPKTAPKHFENSLKNVRSSLSKESLVFYDHWDKKFGSKFHLTASELPEFLRPKPIEGLD